jgi:murein DD-endopeptidase MepM/ murein hydrolase activator NlpD
MATPGKAKALVLALAAYTLSACAMGEQLRHGRPPAESARDAYAHAIHGAADPAAVRAWEDASRHALRSGLAIPPSFRERVLFPAGTPHAVAYRFTLRAGQRLNIRYAPLDGGGPLFADMFQDLGGDIFRPVDAAPRGGRDLAFTATATGEFVLRLQPELGRGGLYEISAESDMHLLFPVRGGTLQDVGGVFGDPRDGGARRHEGVDIFAPRGTPVVAVTDGQVTRVGTDRLGGRVVWLYDEHSGLSYYYAHLDEQHVRQGARVRAGDVLGTVGNSGNARRAPPHLHFGVYRAGRVAIDPAPLLVAGASDVAVEAAGDLRRLGQWARTTVERVRLRSSPSLAGAIMAELDADTPVLVIGHVADWHRVLLQDGTTGFVSAQFTTVDENGGSGR